MIYFISIFVHMDKFWQKFITGEFIDEVEQLWVGFNDIILIFFLLNFLFVLLNIVLNTFFEFLEKYRVVV